jgi:hypothetical protein
MAAKVIDFTDRVACIKCTHFEDAKDNSMNIDKCLHPDNLENQWGYKYGAWKKPKVHPQELNQRGLCKKCEEQDATNL